MCLAVCMLSNFFHIATPTVFVWFSQNLAHLIYVPMCKKPMEQIFIKVLIVKKFLSIFFKFSISPNSWNHLTMHAVNVNSPSLAMLLSTSHSVAAYCTVCFDC